MNATILQENLLRALVRTARVLTAKAQLPILQNTLLVAGDGGLRITATNLETTETVRVGAKVEKDGGLCVPGRTLTELVASFSQEPVHLIVHEGSLHVASGKSKAVVAGVAASEFPPLQSPAKPKRAKIKKDTLVSALDRVLFAAATDDGRPLLTGVKMITQGETTVVVATDGYRLSLQKIAQPLVDRLDVVIPARALSEMLKVCTEEKDLDEIGVSLTDEGQLHVVIGDTEITTRLIAGEYPSFEKIIPKSFTTRVLVDKQSLSRAVKSAAIFARDSANIIKFHIENQSMTVSANAPQIGENSVEVEAKVDGEGGDMALNSRFLLDFFANFNEDELLFEMTGSLNPGVFRPVKDDSFLHLIMPVRV